MDLIRNLTPKYQHYWLILLAILCFAYVLEPMLTYRQSQVESLSLLEKRVDKIASLLEQKDDLIEQQSRIESLGRQASSYTFPRSDVNTFRLQVQMQIEMLMKSAKCNELHFIWKSENKSLVAGENLDVTNIEVKLEGPLTCLIKLNRDLEALKPMYRIAEFSYFTRSWNGHPGEKITAILTIQVWRLGEAL